ncbi:MAG TPA: hypothetical protein VN541_21430 [Tepidisphaeraceae bacterium]|nr:hypothetical protein [Tepidisphaeraceae bacterium]
MPLWSQHLLVLLAVAGCLAFVVWQAAQSLRGRKSKLNGCGTCNSCGTTPVKSQSPPTNRVAIVPVEMLRRRK